jgi:hypothetical protein
MPIIKEPILATANEETRERIFVKGGLHFIKGNSAPYFSITADLPGLGMGGCCHDEIKKAFGDRFNDLIALHLSDHDGVPMHAAGNAFYWAGGCGRNELTEVGFFRSQLRDLAKRYGREDYLKAAESALRIEGPDTVWKRWDQTPNAQHLASLLRISESDAQLLVDSVCGEGFSKEDMALYVESLKPRWNEEAKACITKHGLIVFGDTWQASAA